jgi:hypothetical protein
MCADGVQNFQAFPIVIMNCEPFSCFKEIIDYNHSKILPETPHQRPSSGDFFPEDASRKPPLNMKNH